MSYYDDYLKQVKSVTDAQKKALEETKKAGNQVALEKLNADNAAIEQTYGTQITETEGAYDDALRRNEVQLQLNRRAVERRMAEMGLTDSGLNRTQQTATQLSYANQKGSLYAQRQKAVDTLAAAMQQGMAQNQLGYNATVAQNNADYSAGIASIDAQNAANASDYSAKMTEAASKAIETQAKSVQDAYSDVVKMLSDADIDEGIKQNAVLNYASQYGFSSAREAQALLNAAGFEGQYTLTELPDGTLEIDFPEDVNTMYSYGGSSLPTMDYTTAGSQGYVFKVKKDHKNFLGIGPDRNDVVDIYYPDGRLLASDVELKKLGVSRADMQSLTDMIHQNKTHSANEGRTFQFTVDLKNLKNGKIY